MSERIGVIRENGVVVNWIVWADHTPDQLIAEGITDFQEVTGLSPMPGVGWTWNETDGYRQPQPFPSWTWNGVDWEAPTPEPSEGGPYSWNEQTQSWEPFTIG